MPKHMLKLATPFFVSALVGAVLAAVNTTHATPAGYYQKLHAHVCRTTTVATLEQNRLSAVYGTVLASCPLGGSTTATVVSGTNAEGTATVSITTYYKNPSPANPISVQLCGAELYLNRSACSAFKYSSTTAAAGYGEFASTHVFPNPYQYYGMIPTVFYWLPAGMPLLLGLEAPWYSSLQGLTVKWL